MEKYFQSFPLVEVQQTFYQPPQIKTLEKWRAQASRGFEFTLKAWQLITHSSQSPTYRRLKRKLEPLELLDCGAFKPTPMVADAWNTTMECARALSAKRVLFQCPASFTPVKENIENLHHFFTTIDRGQLKLLWEPRGGWPKELVRALCKDLHLTHVVDPFKDQTETPDSLYYRLHGRNGYRYRYEESELEELLAILPKRATSYVLFNNVYMLEDATRFQQLADQQPR